jgi:hypothetical protein
MCLPVHSKDKHKAVWDMQLKMQFIYEISNAKSQLAEETEANAAGSVSTDEQPTKKHRGASSSSGGGSKISVAQQQIDALKQVLQATLPQPQGPTVPRTLDDLMTICSMTDAQKARIITYLNLPASSSPPTVHAGLAIDMSDDTVSILKISHVQASIWTKTLDYTFKH